MATHEEVIEKAIFDALRDVDLALVAGEHCGSAEVLIDADGEFIQVEQVRFGKKGLDVRLSDGTEFVVRVERK